jgi:hypothetical protein
VKQFRDERNGQFGFDGQWDRLCTCGHRLGVHGAGGVDCLAGTNVPDDPNPRGIFCDCEKFRQSRKRAALHAPSVTKQ